LQQKRAQKEDATVQIAHVQGNYHTHPYSQIKVVTAAGKSKVKIHACNNENGYIRGNGGIENV